MAGHFRRRGSRWYFWIELEPGPNGERRQRSMGGFRTRREAEDAYAEMRRALRAGEYLEPSQVTLETFLVTQWLPSIEMTTRPTTADHYRKNIEGYVLPKIGGRRLLDVTPVLLNAFYAELLRSGRRKVRAGAAPSGLSPSTVHHVHSTLHKALNDAVRWGLLSRNPSDRADPPRPAYPEMQAWSPDQLRAFLRSREEDRLFAAWLLLITTGLRRGELLGLRWQDVDIETRRISIVRAHVLVNRQMLISEPKTRWGRRTVALDVATAGELVRHRRRQLRERFALGEAWVENDLVFTLEDGAPIPPRLFSSWFSQHARDAGLPHIRLHDYADLRVMPNVSGTSWSSGVNGLNLSA